MKLSNKALFAALLPLALAAVAGAQTIKPILFRYSQDLSTLGRATGAGVDRQLYLEFQISDGTQSGNGNTSVTLSNFSLTGGTLGGALEPNIGGVTTNPNGSITLRDNVGGLNGGLADYARGFTIPAGTMGARLEFDFEVAPTSFDAPTPDYFLVQFLTADLTSLTTDTPPTNAVGSESLGILLSGDPLTQPQTYTVTSEYAAYRGSIGDPRFNGFAKPTFKVLAIPEPASLAALGFGALALSRRRRKTARPNA